MTTLEALHAIRDSRCPVLCNDPGPFKEPICVTVEELIAELEDLGRIKAGIRASGVWADDWCPVCEEHPSHDHGQKDCPMRKE